MQISIILDNKRQNITQPRKIVWGFHCQKLTTVAKHFIHSVPFFQPLFNLQNEQHGIKIVPTGGVFRSLIGK